MEYHDLNELENMMISIIEDGKYAVWQDIEKVKNPLDRCRLRRLFFMAQYKLKSENDYEV